MRSNSAERPEEWLAHPQGQAIADAPPIEIVRQGDGARVAFEPAASRPLERLRVLDFTHVVAGPTIGKLLAEHGADVIHCRNPYLDHILGFDIDTSFGKKNAYVDLRADADRARALELIRDCDVFVQGFRWGSLAKRGLGSEDLWRVNPRLIYVEVNAYGFEGPWAERRGWEQLAQAATGLASVAQRETGKIRADPRLFQRLWLRLSRRARRSRRAGATRRGGWPLDRARVARQDGHARHALRRQSRNARPDRRG